MIDIHAHLLYGVDDGPKTIEESVEMLKIAKAQGVNAMILTPHYRHGMFAYPGKTIIEHFQKLYPYAQEIGVQIYLGTEHHVNSMVLEYIETGRVHTLAGTYYVLAEYKHDTEFSYIKASIQDMLHHGYIPIVAHAERYMCMNKNIDNVDTIREMGALIQVNADAILGIDGLRAKHFTKKLLKYEWVDFVGSDSHGIRQRASNMGKCAEYLYKKYDKDYIDEILEGNAIELLHSEKR